MANYTAAALLAAQVAFEQKFNEPELRRKQNPALMLGLKNQEVTVVNHQELKKKADRPVKAYIRTKRAASALAAKSHNHTGTKADSKEVTLSWITVSEPFTVHLKQGQSNIHSYSEMLKHELMESAKNIHDRLGTLALAYLQANRCQLAAPATGGAGNWNAVNFALEIAADKSNLFYLQAQSFMRTQKYRGQLDVIADQPAFRQQQFLTAQGQANNTNFNFQMSGMDIAETIEAIDANYENGAVLMMPSGVFAALPWNDPANLRGKGDYDSHLGGYGTIKDPLGSGLLMDFHAYTERADGSAAGGGVQDEVLESELSMTIAWVTAPINVANESPIYEIAQLV